MKMIIANPTSSAKAVREKGGISVIKRGKWVEMDVKHLTPVEKNGLKEAGLLMGDDARKWLDEQKASEPKDQAKPEAKKD